MLKLKIHQKQWATMKAASKSQELVPSPTFKAGGQESVSSRWVLPTGAFNSDGDYEQVYKKVCYLSFCF